MASLSGPNSRRSLGTRSGAMRREARRLEREGYSAGGAYAAAAEQKLLEGSGIRNTAQGDSFEQKQRRLTRGLLESQRRTTLGGEAAATAEPAAPAQSAQQSRMGFYERQRQSRMDFYGGAAPAAEAPASTVPPVSPPGATSPVSPPGVTPPVSARPSPTAPDREGRINGMPASQAIAQADASLREGGARQEYGADIAKRNMESGGFKSALEDYRRRQALDADRSKRGAAYVDAQRTPGNTQGLQDSVSNSVPILGGVLDAAKTPAPGRLQGFLNQAVAERNAKPAPVAAAASSVPSPVVPSAPSGSTPLPEVEPPASAMRSTAPRQQADTGLNVALGPYKNRDTTFLAARDKSRAKKAAEDAKNKELMSHKSGRPGLLTRMGLRKPSYLEDTIAGDLYDSLNK